MLIHFEYVTFTHSVVRSYIPTLYIKSSTNNETIFRNWDIKKELIPDFQQRLNRIYNFVADTSTEDSKQVASDLQVVLETFCQIHFGEEFAYTKRIGELEHELI